MWFDLLNYFVWPTNFYLNNRDLVKMAHTNLYSHLFCSYKNFLFLVKNLEKEEDRKTKARNKSSKQITWGIYQVANK